MISGSEGDGGEMRGSESGEESLARDSEGLEERVELLKEAGIAGRGVE